LFYDFGYKNIQIYTRVEEYWATDCGWWYIGDTETVGVNITDAGGDELKVVQGLSTSKGRVEFTYPWGLDDDPGEWTVTVNATNGTGDSVNTATFTIYVRGKLDVSSISFNTSTPNVGESVLISASVKDHTGNSVNGSAVDNNGTTVAPWVNAYVVGGGDSFEVTLYDDGSTGGDTAIDAVWMGETPPFAATGDHKVKVKAEDGHQYWVEGGGSSFVSVKGTFPYASVFMALTQRILGVFPSNFSLSSILASLTGLGGLVAVRRRWWSRG
jgi:hypothetical protein